MGQPVIVLEAMKMEIAVEAPRAGSVTRVACAVGDLVQAGTILAEIGEE
jgi:biotin carboxyl carrier protein